MIDFYFIFIIDLNVSTNLGKQIGRDTVFLDKNLRRWRGTCLRALGGRRGFNDERYDGVQPHSGPNRRTDGGGGTDGTAPPTRQKIQPPAQKKYCLGRLSPPITYS